MKISNLMTVASTPSTKGLPSFKKRTEISITKVVMIAFDGGRGYHQRYPRATWVIVGGTGEEFTCSFNRFTWESRAVQEAALAYLLGGKGTLELNIVSGPGTGMIGGGKLSYNVVA